MAKLPSSLDMLKAGVHFGHQSSRWHPKMREYMYGVKGGVHIIDVEKTQEQLEKALNFISTTVANGGTILFVGTKVQAKDVVARAGKDCGMPYVSNRWLGGTLTNFPQIQRLIRHYLDLKDKREKGDLKKYTKLEQLQFDREIEELDEKIGGISTMTRLPDAVFILDARTEKTVVREATSVHIPLVALVDSNVNPVGIRYVIPGNDDATASLDMIAKLVAEAVKEGKTKAMSTARAAMDARRIEEEVKLSQKSKETVDAMDDKMKDKLAGEAASQIKK